MLLYEGVLSAIKGYQKKKKKKKKKKKLGLDVEVNFVDGDSRVWKCIGKGNVKDIYACLIANCDTSKCVDSWNKTLDVLADTKEIFDNIFNTTNNTFSDGFGIVLEE